MTTRTTRHQRKSRAGFTLLEILVVVAIIAALAAVGVVYLLPQGDKAKRDICKTEIKTIEQALTLYHDQHYGNWPESLQVLLSQDEQGLGPYLQGEEAIFDEWGQPYGYDPTATDPQGVQKPRIWSQSPQAQQYGISNF